MPADLPPRSPRFVVVGVGLQALAYISLFASPTFANYSPWLMIVGLAVALPGLILLAAPRRHADLGWLRLAAGLLALILVIGFGAALWLPQDSAGAPMFLGLPRRAAMVLLGVGVLPFLILPVIHAWRFDANGLDPVGLAELRREAARLRGESPGLP